jgi:hypothetical protein
MHSANSGRNLLEQFDFIFADGCDFERISPENFDIIIMVSTLDPACIRACSALSQKLAAMEQSDKLRLILNKIPKPLPMLDKYESLDDIVDAAGARLVGAVPIIKNFSAKDSYVYTSNIALRLLGGKAKLAI